MSFLQKNTQKLPDASKAPDKKESKKRLKESSGTIPYILQMLFLIFKTTYDDPGTRL